jgi:hypothetical protein
MDLIAIHIKILKIITNQFMINKIILHTLFNILMDICLLIIILWILIIPKTTNKVEKCMNGIIKVYINNKIIIIIRFYKIVINLTKIH